MRSSLGLVAALALLPGLAGAEALIGPGVGNADLLLADGMRLYNEKVYDQARDRFLKATRVAPAALPTYLALARTYSALKDLERAIVVYRVYVKNAPESPDRDKAQAELELCERQFAASGSTPALGASYVALKATYFDVLDKGALLGPGSAAELLTSIVGAGYAAPDLGDMAAKLARAAETAADEIYAAATAKKRAAPLSVPDLRRAGALYQLALDTGSAPARQAARAAFLEGVALLVEAKANQAEIAFEDASKKDPADLEARFYRAFAKYSAGDKAGALKLLEAELPADPRTAVLRVAVAMDGPPAEAAAELEKLLFARRYKGAP